MPVNRREIIRKRSAHHDCDVVPLFVDVRWRFHLVERFAHGVEEQLVLGQVLPRLHYQVDELQSTALALRLTPLPTINGYTVKDIRISADTFLWQVFHILTVVGHTLQCGHVHHYSVDLWIRTYTEPVPFKIWKTLHKTSMDIYADIFTVYKQFTHPHVEYKILP